MTPAASAPDVYKRQDFKYADALRTADNIMTFKLAVKTLAQKNGLHATFMPKPIFGVNGSGKMCIRDRRRCPPRWPRPSGLA